MDESNIAAGVMAGAGIIVLLIILTIGLVCYIIKSLSIMHFAAARNMEGRWMAWIPFVDVYLLTNATYQGEEEVTQELINVQIPIAVYQFQSVLVWLGSIVLGMIPFVGSFASVIIFVARVLLFGQVYKDAMRYSGVEISNAEEIIVGIFPIVGYVRLMGAGK